MFKVLIYGLVTFAETGLGVWIFERMFPERTCLVKRKSLYLWILVAFILVSCYTFPRAYLPLEQRRTFTYLFISICTGPFFGSGFQNKEF